MNTTEDQLQKNAERILGETRVGSREETGVLKSLCKGLPEKDEQIILSVYFRRKKAAKVTAKKEKRRGT